MDLPDLIKHSNILLTDIPKWGAYLRKEWENHFACHLNASEKNDIYLSNKRRDGGYLWHLFSYEKKKCLEGEQAIKAFNQEEKQKCFIFFQHSDHAWLSENASLLSINDLADYTNDLYIADKQFRWTFVITHEKSHGPYFSRNDWR